MTDIAERLRAMCKIAADDQDREYNLVLREAAGEIERLRNDRDDSDAASNDREAEIERLRAEVVRYRGILTSLKVEWHD